MSTLRPALSCVSRSFKFTNHARHMSPTSQGMEVKPSGFDKWSMVAAKMYKNKAEIPEFVRHSQVKKARDTARIRISLYTMLLFALGAVATVLYNRSLQDRVSIYQDAEEYIDGLKRQGKAERDQKEAKQKAA